MNRSDRARPQRGFALLLEVIVVLFVAGLMARAYFWNAPERIMNERIAVEDAVLADMARAIKESLISTDLSGTNIAALPGEIGPGDIPTIFSSSSQPLYTTTFPNDWFAKIAKIQGTTVVLGVAPNWDSQPELARILYNSMGQARLLFIQPETRPEHIQLILVSVLAPPQQLTLPPYQPTSDWFNAIWNHDFANRRLLVPTQWVSWLSPTQLDAWNRGSGGSNLNRLRTVRITIPRYVFHMNNNDPTNTGWVYWNNGGDRLVAPPASGSHATRPIIHGRMIRCASGETEAAASDNYHQPLQSTGSFTVK